ncbi:glycosyltransferase [Methylophilaceae bacterium]|nr:glycosyltransferase [Methylophilaceae bacterium]|tara:strand:- start:507 stop:1631 length:1125 start_codon:yes stop_codon:yes gene_type:complete
MGNRKSICFIATAEFAVSAFLVSHLKELSKYYDLTVIVNLKNPKFLIDQKLDIKLININFSRKISIFLDCLSFVQLTYLFLIKRYDAVHSITPKAGLLAMTASFLTFIPIRVHCFTGQVWVTKSGLSRLLLKLIDKVVGILSTQNIVDSKSQYKFLVKENVLKKDKSLVFGSGSVSGIDLLKFKPNKKVKVKLRNKLKIPSASFVFIFLGRLNSDKGIYDLIHSFKSADLKSAYLLLIGPDEENISTKFKSNHSNIIFSGATSSPQDYLAASDVLCLPSYREGFGNVVIEAAASGLPSIVSNIYGLSDAIIRNNTGLAHEPKDLKEITRLMIAVFNDRKLVANLGKAAQKRAISEFDSKILVKHWKDFYQHNLT